MRATPNSAIIPTAATPDSHPDCRASLIQIVALHLFRGVIPDPLTITVYCWREMNGGADFHARYLLTEKGGVSIDAGFSAEGNHQTTDMHLMSIDLSQKRVAAFTRGSPDYDLVQPVIRVFGNGKKVERV